MRFLIFTLFFILINFNNTFAQSDDAKKQMEKIEKEMDKRQAEYINDFLSTLEVDDFQKEIIKQRMHSYFEAKKTIYVSEPKQFKRDQLVEQLDATHFLDIKEMITEDTMSKIMESVKGTASKKDTNKKKKKKND
jgi:hypothetical protein